MVIVEENEHGQTVEEAEDDVLIDVWMRFTAKLKTPQLVVLFSRLMS